MEAMVWRHRIGLSLTAALSVGSLSADAAAHRALAEASLASVHEIYAALRACWVPPQHTTPAKVQVTIRLSFKRDGEVLGQPLIVYENPDASDTTRRAVQAAVAATLQRCNPLPLSGALGNIIAGHPINVRLGEGWRHGGKAKRPAR
jgi:hypothetical protein